MAAKKSYSSKSGKASSPSKKKPGKSARESKKAAKWSFLNLLKPVLVFFVSILALGFMLWVALLDFQVREKFEGKRWSVPAKVYSRPLEIFQNLKIHPSDLLDELRRLQYQESKSPNRAGTFKIVIHDASSASFVIFTRGFNFSDGAQPSEMLLIEIKNQYVVKSSHTIIRLEPQLIGGIYPSHNEDRILIKLEDTPDFFIETLILVEDREFFDHFGVSPKAIFRAAFVNFFSGRIKQGGSTLTQQLVKNFYLSDERSLKRKINEAIMALLLEVHYSKNEILEAYLNEVNLGQVGSRGIHGFGLAAQHYFGLEIENLDLHQVAMLVALIKGPSLYEPRRNQERAIERRDLVLSLMAENGFISAQQYTTYSAKGLDLTVESALQHQNYPAFLDLVKRQLKSDYSDIDLQSEGLRIFTSLDPLIQNQAEHSLLESIEHLKSANNKNNNNLQGAMVVITPQTGEVLALVGGTDIRVLGFNRALDAKRPVGSLLKPAIYMTALSSKQYHWASMVSDEIVVVDKKGELQNKNIDLQAVKDQKDYWVPQNFDHQVHGENGQVTLLEAMSNSYNQASVRLGLDLGVPEVIKALKILGVESHLPDYPSVLLGAVDLSPFEVTQMYQTIASGGFNTKLRAIREVQNAEGQPLIRYPFNIEQVLAPDLAYLLHVGLQDVVKNGTASSLNQYLPTELALAGKTGTTNDSRDSWYVGYGGNMLATVWLGNDDNSETFYTGASGALKIWTHFAINFPLEPAKAIIPEGVQWIWIEPKLQQLSESGCAGAIFVPMRVAEMPTQYSACATQLKKSPLRRIFGL